MNSDEKSIRVDDLSEEAFEDSKRLRGAFEKLLNAQPTLITQFASKFWSIPNPPFPFLDRMDCAIFRFFEEHNRLPSVTSTDDYDFVAKKLAAEITDEDEEEKLSIEEYLGALSLEPDLFDRLLTLLETPKEYYLDNALIEFFSKFGRLPIITNQEDIDTLEAEIEKTLSSEAFWEDMVSSIQRDELMKILKDTQGEN